MKTKLISLILTVSIVICYNTMIYATGYLPSTNDSSSSSESNSSSSEQSTSNPATNPNSAGTSGNTGALGGPYGSQPETGEGLSTPYGIQGGNSDSGSSEKPTSGSSSNTGSGLSSNLEDPISNPDAYTPDANLQSNNTDFINIGNTVLGVIRLVGTAISVITLMTLGIRYMLGSASEKALYKETMGPYLIGAIMLFVIPHLIGIMYDLVTTNIKIVQNK